MSKILLCRILLIFCFQYMASVFNRQYKPERFYIDVLFYYIKIFIQTINIYVISHKTSVYGITFFDKQIKRFLLGHKH